MIDRDDVLNSDYDFYDVLTLIDKIAELEKENSLLKRVEEIFNASPDLTFDCCKKLFPEDFQAHNLEQQAKGVLDAIEYLGWGDIYTDTSPNMNIGREFRFVAGQLTKEAKALKVGK